MSTTALGLRKSKASGWILATSLPCGRLATETAVLAPAYAISPCGGLFPLRTEGLLFPLWWKQLGQRGMKTQIFKDVWSSKSLWTWSALVTWTLWLFQCKGLVWVLQQNRKLILTHKSGYWLALGYLFSLLQVFDGKNNNYLRDLSQCVKEEYLENVYTWSHNQE